ncbi:flagellar export protein FliJ [Pontibacterium sp. N1Y112]|uniref:Flagellar FliJ protein n=1 Tax=Pontibacterium sinense TaxID=2781979 RepID=A0A8J7JYE5_9GAMM|nr:flagellar export protein FliJ [Pontibacterium sinense]MBE9396389.1 flagellar export protein FliJ [Pontibacterium sinense]
MAKRSQRLRVVLDLAERKKKQADQLLAASRARVEKDKQQIVQLEAFLADYQRQYEDAGRQGFGISKLEVYQSFIRKIATALNQQKNALRMNENELSAVERHWTQCYGQVVAMDKLVDKAQDQERKLEDKKLQQQLDERAQMIKSNFI